jgi:hypothetical protein
MHEIIHFKWYLGPTGTWTKPAHRSEDVKYIIHSGTYYSNKSELHSNKKKGMHGLLGLDYGWLVLLVHPFCDKCKLSFLFSAVQFTLGWTSKHANRCGVVRCIPQASSPLSGEIFDRNNLIQSFKVGGVKI